MKQDIQEEVEAPSGVTVELSDSMMTVKGPKGEVNRAFKAPGIKISVKDNKITLTAKKATKREKKMLYTFRAHLNNMINGVQAPWLYKLKVCSGHFPIIAEVKNNVLFVKNFLGEKIPRESMIPQNVDVKISGADITIESPDRELAGMTASNFEQLTRVTDKDLRRFQDGIYITLKAGKEI